MMAHTADTLFSTWKLDRSNGVLLHVQIERLLRDLISRPPYSSGALLPDELTMASQLGVARGTVRESILNLVHQGFLERRKGVGTRAVQTGLVDWASLTGEMRKKGIEVQSFLLEVSEKAAKGKIADALQVPVGTLVKFSGSDGNSRQTDWIRSLALQAHPCRTACLRPHQRLE